MAILNNNLIFIKIVWSANFFFFILLFYLTLEGSKGHWGLQKYLQYTYYIQYKVINHVQYNSFLQGDDEVDY